MTPSAASIRWRTSSWGRRPRRVMAYPKPSASARARQMSRSPGPAKAMVAELPLPCSLAIASKQSPTPLLSSNPPAKKKVGAKGSAAAGRAALRIESRDQSHGITLSAGRPPTSTSEREAFRLWFDTHGNTGADISRLNRQFFAQPFRPPPQKISAKLGRVDVPVRAAHFKASRCGVRQISMAGRMLLRSSTARPLYASALVIPTDLKLSLSSASDVLPIETTETSNRSARSGMYSTEAH